MTSRPKKSPSSKRKSNRAAAPPAALPARKIFTHSRRRTPRPTREREFLAELRPGIERETEIMPCDNLCKFMRHWLASRRARERHSLYRQLPANYSLGRALAAV